MRCEICGDTVYARAMCRNHYVSWLRHGDPLAAREKFHGMTGTRLYHIWDNMIGRCYRPSNTWYHNYGGVGISVCDEWRKFLGFMQWALSNGYAEHLTLERLNPARSYEPSNCTWIPKSEQSRNTKRNVRLTAFGETKIQRDWLDDLRCAVSIKTLRKRLAAGWTTEEAISLPPYTTKEIQ